MSTPSAVRTGEGAAGKGRTEQQAAAICVSVIAALGRPLDLFRVSAVRLWDNHYRVNVQTGGNASAVSIPHSFFVTSDEAGNILDSTPRITRVY